MAEGNDIDGSSVAKGGADTTKVRAIARFWRRGGARNTRSMQQSALETCVEYGKRCRRLLKFSKGTFPRQRDRSRERSTKRPLSRQWGPT